MSPEFKAPVRGYSEDHVFDMFMFCEVLELLAIAVGEDVNLTVLNYFYIRDC